ncbi:hypothetical protein KC8_05985 [Sphingomonas sp. KC8]|jgi:hypothetical protein|nr:hypothetical protein KC8_05985 [Sphingomonas sp. KC8]
MVKLMKFPMILAVVAATALQAPAFAQTEAPAIKARATVYSADGTKIGRIDKLVEDSSGAVTGARIVYRGKFITIPANSLAADGDHLKTSLTNDVLKKM